MDICIAAIDSQEKLALRQNFPYKGGMDISKRAELLERRAKNHGLRMRDVCTAADLNFSTFWRWKKGEASPSLDAWERLTATIEHLCSGEA